MTDETANLALEILKKLQGDFALMREDILGMRIEMTGMKQHMAAFMQSELRQDSDIASIRLRPDRIERRLDLTDA